ncbi:MAG: PASTA domain-containing protein [Candidatus Cyclobacteriaceae bacterium M3_2C_046]
MKIKANSFKDVLIHLGIISGLGVILIILFFYVYLPYTTNHGESITLPDLEGIPYEEINEFLTSRDLRYEVRADSGYSDQYPPLAVLDQHPDAGSQVKENRKIYLTLNAQQPPLVEMPKLVEGSMKNAETTLKNIGLEVGELKYEPNLFENVVLDQLYKGNSVEAGTQIPKGSAIDLVIGDGLGKQVFEMPDLVGREFDEAEVYIAGVRLEVGSILNEEAEDEFTGIIMKQIPEAGSNVRSGELVDLWVGNLPRYDSLNTEEEEMPQPQL